MSPVAVSTWLKRDMNQSLQSTNRDAGKWQLERRRLHTDTYTTPPAPVPCALLGNVLNTRGLRKSVNHHALRTSTLPKGRHQIQARIGFFLGSHPSFGRKWGWDKGEAHHVLVQMRLSSCLAFHIPGVALAPGCPAFTSLPQPTYSHSTSASQGWVPPLTSTNVNG